MTGSKETAGADGRPRGRECTAVCLLRNEWCRAMVGLMDCNNFFVSCERVFQPELADKAVVVLSNNDGCVVARSNEAKALGIKMGEPYFRIRQLVERGEVLVRSGNLRLYGDMSRRVMSVAQRFVPHIEQYSIDECFLDLDGVQQPVAVCRELVKVVRQWTGIPVSVGVAPTKTLAKVASKFAKKYAGYHGCCLIDTDEKRVKALRLTPVGEVWGVGRRHLPLLLGRGVKTAYDLTCWNEDHVRHLLALPGVRMWNELKGKPMIPLEQAVAKQSITASRSFRNVITDYELLRSLIADFASICADKLRRDGSAARMVTAYIRTDRFRPDQPQYGNSGTVTLDVATSDLREIVAAATRALQSVYREGYGYKKAGVSLSGITHGCVQAHLFDTVDRERQQRLLEAVDRVREKNGVQALRVASQESFRTVMNSEHRSPDYTTRLQDVIKVK